jgi:hypothetical protein
VAELLFTRPENRQYSLMEIDPTAVGATLARDFEKAQRLFRQVLARQLVLGRQLQELQEHLGPAFFVEWLAKFCPSVSPQDAGALIQYSVNSGLAQKVEDLLQLRQQRGV